MLRILDGSPPSPPLEATSEYHSPIECRFCRNFKCYKKMLQHLCVDLRPLCVGDCEMFVCVSSYLYRHRSKFSRVHKLSESSTIICVYCVGVLMVTCFEVCFVLCICIAPNPLINSRHQTIQYCYAILTREQGVRSLQVPFRIEVKCPQHNQ